MLCVCIILPFVLGIYSMVFIIISSTTTLRESWLSIGYFSMPVYLQPCVQYGVAQNKIAQKMAISWNAQGQGMDVVGRTNPGWQFYMIGTRYFLYCGSFPCVQKCISVHMQRTKCLIPVTFTYLSRIVGHEYVTCFMTCCGCLELGRGPRFLETLWTPVYLVSCSQLMWPRVWKTLYHYQR
jgi:hypothetical protein